MSLSAQCRFAYAQYPLRQFHIFELVGIVGAVCDHAVLSSPTPVIAVCLRLLGSRVDDCGVVPEQVRGIGKLQRHGVY